MELRWLVFPHVSWIWLTWERMYMRRHPVEPVRPGALFQFRKVGSIVELHLDSRRLRRMRDVPGYSAFTAVHQMRDELGVLAARIRARELGEVNVVKGTSLMGEAGAVLGFETRRLPRNFSTVLQQYFMVGLDAIYHPSGLRERSKRRWPVESWMGVEALEARYGAKSDSSRVAR